MFLSNPLSRNSRTMWTLYIRLNVNELRGENARIVYIRLNVNELRGENARIVVVVREIYSILKLECCLMV